MFEFIKKMFAVVIGFTGLNVNALKCVSMSNQECKVKSAIININSNEPLFYFYSIFVNKYSGSCSNINNPYSKL